MKGLYTKSQTEWPLEPTNSDPSWSKYGESFVSWMERSTLERAKAFRQFLRRNLAEIPSEYREHFIHALKERWNSAFLEFILARVIQVLGGEFEIEPLRPNGKRPDFLVSFGDRKLIIEVVSPVFDRKGDEERKRDAELLEFINTNTPDGWSISIIQLPTIGAANSKKEFKQQFQQVCQDLPTNPEKRWYSITKTLSSGPLQLAFYPEKLGHEPIVSSKMYPFVNDEEKKIRQAIKDKRPQVHREVLPVLLAIYGSGYAVTFDCFDHALFGTNPDGIFVKPGRKNKRPTFAGVLAFTRIDCQRKSDPGLYHHPRFAGELPDELMNFEQRRFQIPKGISIQAPRQQNVLGELGFMPNINKPAG